MSHFTAKKSVVANEILLAIDGGGTKTEVVAFCRDGTVLTQLFLPASLNPNGAEVPMAEVLGEVFQRLSVRISMPAVSAVVVGVAGGEHASVQAQVQDLLGAQFSDAVRVHVIHDAVAALWSGLAHVPGLVLIAGTGSVAFGLDAQGQPFRVGGWGYLIGDDGGGYDLGKRALRAVTDQFDGVGPHTILTERILSSWAVATVPDLVPLIYQPGKSRIASLARLVCEATRDGDAVARGIVSDVAESAAVLLKNVVRIAIQQHELTLPLPVVLVGGLWQSPEMKAAFDAHLSALGLAPQLQVLVPNLPPVFGAARFLLQAIAAPTDAEGMAAFEANFTASFQAVETVDFTAASQLLQREAGEVDRSAKVGESSAQWSGLDLSALGTEAGDPTLRDLDTWDSLAIVRLIARSNQDAVGAVAVEAGRIAAAIDAIYPRIAAGGRLFYVGAGTSGRLGVLDASECPPTFGVPQEMVQGVIAGGESALTVSAEGAEDVEVQGGADLLARGLTSADVVVAIAASGRTPYCIGALQAAADVGALTVSVACNRAAPMSAWAEHSIEVATGAEVVAGSTRMKAGTAQKVVLNMLTTTVMIRLGKVFNGQMVDMVPSNHKLKLRARRIVMLAGVVASEAEAAALLEQARGNIKAAIVMAQTGVSYATALQLLVDHNGHVRAIISAHNEK
jgi:N-acetylmuramic acid 6-phosphate etherase